MYFALILLAGLKPVYGPIPHIPNESDETVEIWGIEESDSDLLDEYFVEAAWNLIHSLVDWGETDMYDAEQCAKLAPWLAAQIQREDIPARLVELYAKMKEFCERAVRLGTGVIIDM